MPFRGTGMRRRNIRLASARAKTKQGGTAQNHLAQLSRYDHPPGLGILYMSFGAVYKDMARLSIRLLRRFGYSGPIRILSDCQGWMPEDLDCELLSVPNPGLGFATRHYKTQINKYAFDITLFLDADTLPIAPIRTIWRELRLADICMPVDWLPTVQSLVNAHFEDCKRDRLEYSYMSSLGLMEHPFYNSGVMLFKQSTSTDRLFEAWYDEWRCFCNRDQLPLVRAIARTKSVVHTLAPRWNAKLGLFRSVHEARNLGVRILHNEDHRPDLQRKFFPPPVWEARLRKCMT